jgi:hypothetical protein
MRMPLFLSLLCFWLNVAYPEEALPPGGGAPSVAPSPSPVSISREEKAKIYFDFKKKLSEEERIFEKDEKSKRRELIRMQNDRRKQWRESERKARRLFFETHQSGPDRRQYVQGFVKRKKAFDADEKHEWVEFNRKQSEDRKTFRISRQERTRRVSEALERNERPEP